MIFDCSQKSKLKAVAQISEVVRSFVIYFQGDQTLLHKTHWISGRASAFVIVCDTVFR